MFLGADYTHVNIQHVGVLAVQRKVGRTIAAHLHSVGVAWLEGIRPGASRVKARIVIIALCLGSAIGAETNSPPANSLVSISKVDASVACFEWEQIDTEVYLPNGMEKKQFVYAFKRHVVSFYHNGEMVAATNTASKVIVRIVPVNDRKTIGVPAIPMPPMPPQ